MTTTTADGVYVVRDELRSLLTPVDELHPHPQNPRRSQLGPIAESLQLHGQYRPVIAQLDGTVIAGNHTLAAARYLGWTHVAAQLLDVDDERARRIMLVDNRTSDLATYDDAELSALLAELSETDASLDGTGYNADDLAALLAQLDAELPDVLDGDETQAPIVPRTFGVYDRELIVQTMIDEYRASGFPYPQRVPLHRAMADINALAQLDDAALRTSRLGYAVADGYQPHRFDVTVTNMTSPVDVFADDRRLRLCIERMLDDGISLSEATFRSNVSLTRGGQAASNFRPGFALQLMRRYGAGASSMLDCSTGFGGRLVGFLASELSTYVGIDPSTRTDAGNRALVADLCPASKRVELHCMPAEDVDPASLPQCEFAFTSPPYFVKEQYADEPTQSWVRYPTIEAWRDGFLFGLLRLQHAVLVPGAANVVNIADVTIGGREHPLLQMTCDVATEVGFVVEHVDELRLTHRFGSHQSTEVTVEPVIVMRRS
jgi:hypothetical protein